MGETNGVQLYIYDLTSGMAAMMSQMLLGRHIEGVWHTAVVVYGREFFYGGSGIQSCLPVSTKWNIISFACKFRTLCIVKMSVKVQCILFSSINWLWSHFAWQCIAELNDVRLVEKRKRFKAQTVHVVRRSLHFKIGKIRFDTKIASHTQLKWRKKNTKIHSASNERRFG